MRCADVPGYITAGLMDERVVELGEMVIETTGHTDETAVIREARREAARLIAARREQRRSSE